MNLGFLVTTLHHLDAEGRWVRSLQYLRIDGQNSGGAVAPTGVLLAKRGPKTRRQEVRVVATTRTFSGGIMMFDMPWGKGLEKKITTHWRTCGVSNPNAANAHDDGGPDLVFSNKMNYFWQTLLIQNTETTWQMVNQVRWDALVLPQYFVKDDLWYPPNVSGYPGIFPDLDAFTGIAGILAMFFAAIYHNGASIVEETWSRLAASDGDTIAPEHWLPYRDVVDSEHPEAICKLLGIEYDGEKGHVSITKEVLP